MKPKYLLIGILPILAFLGFHPNQALAYQRSNGRTISLTLIPNYVDQSIRFDGSVELSSTSTNPDLSGLPLRIEHDWVDVNNISNLLGVVEGGKIEFDSEEEIYHLVLGPVILEPGDKISFVLPFVNLDYERIQPLPDVPDQVELITRQFANRFSFRAGDTPRSGRSISHSSRLPGRSIWS